MTIKEFELMQENEIKKKKTELKKLLRKSNIKTIEKQILKSI